MIQTPQVIGLVLCDELQVDLAPARVSLTGVFHTRRPDAFPSAPQNVTVYTTLSDGAGEGRMRLEIIRLETGETIYTYERWFAFLADRLLILNLEIPVRKCIFPAPGRYGVRLLFDQELAAERAFVVK